MNIINLKISLFNNLIVCNPVLLVVDIVAVILFLYLYYKKCYKNNIVIDFWHWILFIPYFITVLLMYPFAASPNNAISLGNDLLGAANFTDQAFLIHLLGFFSFYIGATLYKKNYIFDNIRQKIININIAVFSKISCNEQLVIKIIILLYLILITIFYIYGFTFFLRDIAMLDGQFRPIYNLLFSVIFPFVFQYMLLNFIINKNKYSLIFCLAFFILLSFANSRTSLLLPIINIVVIYFIVNKTNKIYKIFLWGLAFVITFLLIDKIRINIFLSTTDLNSASFVFRLLYGNNFADLRDFSAVLAHWNGEFISGKSYIAAFMSFIPREFSEFRTEWGISRYTTQTLLNFADLHPGMRCGWFGEAFFNFGYLGVILVGVIGGYLAKYINDSIINISCNLSLSQKYIKVFSLFIVYDIFSNFYITAAFWNFYIKIGLLLIAYYALIYRKIGNKNV